MNERLELIKSRKQQRKRKRIIKTLSVVIIILFIILVCLAVKFFTNKNIALTTTPIVAETPVSTPANTTTASPKKAEPTPAEQSPEGSEQPVTDAFAPSSTTPAETNTTETPQRGTKSAIPENIKSQMNGVSMPSNATITYDELSYLTIPHYDFNGNVVEGHLVVNAAVADEVLDIFAELFAIKYPIERMELIDKYGGSDFQSIENNNTSAFNFRYSTTGSGKLSKHALGRAIDINPQQNPYVKSNGTGSHPNAKEFWSRDVSKWKNEVDRAAYIGHGTEIYKIFTSRGWTWGGNWENYRDYQHFEKTH